jgi:hypothetical protein
MPNPWVSLRRDQLIPVKRRRTRKNNWKKGWRRRRWQKNVAQKFGRLLLFSKNVAQKKTIAP